MTNFRNKSKGQLVKEIVMLRKQIGDLKSSLHHEYAQIQNKLTSNENRYQSILENIEEAYFELDLRGNIIFFNKAMSEMLGYSPKELMGLNYRAYVDPKTAIRLFKIFNKIYTTGKPAEIFENKIIRKDGTKRYRESSAALILDSQNRPIGFRCLTRDITKRKLTEEALEKKDRELMIKSSSLRESNMALKVLLEQMENDKIELERNALANVKKIIMPYIGKLKKSRLTANQLICVETIETNLMNLISPFLRNITAAHFNLTSKELEVANLVKEGKTTKEIANFLGVSTAAVDFHRNNIRKKLSLINKKANLRSYLLSLS